MSSIREFLEARLARAKEMIVAYETAVEVLVRGGVQSYTLNTSQTTQTVTKFDLPELNKMIDVLYNRCATLEARLGRSGTTYTGAPDW